MCCQFLLNAYCSAFSVLSCQSVLSASHTCLVKRFLSGFFATIVANLHLSSPLLLYCSRFSVLCSRHRLPFHVFAPAVANPFHYLSLLGLCLPFRVLAPTVASSLHYLYLQRRRVSLPPRDVGQRYPPAWLGSCPIHQNPIQHDVCCIRIDKWVRFLGFSVFRFVQRDL